MDLEAGAVLWTEFSVIYGFDVKDHGIGHPGHPIYTSRLLRLGQNKGVVYKSTVSTNEELWRNWVEQEFR